MIRDSKRLRASFVIVICAASISLASATALAGDTDGVLGYSMKLKNRIITTGETGGSGEGLVGGATVNTTSASHDSTFGAQCRSLVIISIDSYRYWASWTWMFLQAR